jgi:DNA polymerase III alpha subunit (gram-positive type)
VSRFKLLPKSLNYFSKNMTEIYVSTDIETDGPIPGPNSMISLASAAYLKDKTLVGTFTINLKPMAEGKSDLKTMEWWKSQPAAWQVTQVNPQDPLKAMQDYLTWLKSLPGSLVFVAYPAGFDFLFVYWYLIRFTGESPFSYSALDIRTYAMAMLKTEYSKATKRSMPKRWMDPIQHSHVALDDAIEQGSLFCNMLAENMNL